MNYNIENSRRFGIEIELNTIKGKNIEKSLVYVADLISRVTGEQVNITSWHRTHNNEHWLVKPDSSCGLEICSPPLKGSDGLGSITKIIDALLKDDKIRANNKCSLHVHIDLHDCSNSAIEKILAYWIKSEMVFLDAMPLRRKKNQYCQCVGLSYLFEHNQIIESNNLIKKLGQEKYWTINTYHLIKDKRRTIEFRILEAAGPLYANSRDVTCWIKLLLTFCEAAMRRNMPGKYEAGDPWSSLLWLDVEQVIELLDFNDDLQEVKKWFLLRIISNSFYDNDMSIWSDEGRRISIEQSKRLIGSYSADNKDI